MFNYFDFKKVILKRIITKSHLDLHYCIDNNPYLIDACDLMLTKFH